MPEVQTIPFSMPEATVLAVTGRISSSPSESLLSCWNLECFSDDNCLAHQNKYNWVMMKVTTLRVTHTKKTCASNQPDNSIITTARASDPATIIAVQRERGSDMFFTVTSTACSHCCSQCCWRRFKSFSRVCHNVDEPWSLSNVRASCIQWLYNRETKSLFIDCDNANWLRE